MTLSPEMTALTYVLVIVLSYFWGNISWAIAISRMRGRDIRTLGSGNPGTMNMIRNFGKIIGAINLTMDVFKGVLPTLLGWLFLGDGEFLVLGADRIGAYVGGIAVTIGHVFPVMYKFKGGKGVATIIGCCLTLQPILTVLSFGVGVAFLFITNIGSLTSFIIICPPMAYEGYLASMQQNGAICAILVFFLFALTMFAHRNNIIKMFAGREGRVPLLKRKNKNQNE